MAPFNLTRNAYNAFLNRSAVSVALFFILRLLFSSSDHLFPTSQNACVTPNTRPHPSHQRRCHSHHIPPPQPPQQSPRQQYTDGRTYHITTCRCAAVTSPQCRTWSFPFPSETESLTERNNSPIYCPRPVAHIVSLSSCLHHCRTSAQ